MFYLLLVFSLLSSSTSVLVLLPAVAISYAYFVNKKHILNMLLFLEFATMMSMLTIVVSNFNSNSLMLVMMIFFTLAVCEACIGISILIKLSRMTGNDKINMIQ